MSMAVWQGRWQLPISPHMSKCGMPRRRTLHSREGCSPWVPDDCSDLALPPHSFLVRGYTEGHFSSSHFGCMSSRKSQKWTESLLFWVMRRAEKGAVLGINSDVVRVADGPAHLSTTSLGGGLCGQQQEKRLLSDSIPLFSDPHHYRGASTS